MQETRTENTPIPLVCIYSCTPAFANKKTYAIAQANATSETHGPSGKFALHEDEAQLNKQNSTGLQTAFPSHHAEGIRDDFAAPELTVGRCR